MGNSKSHVRKLLSIGMCLLLLALTACGGGSESPRAGAGTESPVSQSEPEGSASAEGSPVEAESTEAPENAGTPENTGDTENTETADSVKSQDTAETSAVPAAAVSASGSAETAAEAASTAGTAEKAAEADIYEKYTLKIKQGEVVALIGTNGSGKSTLLKLMTKIIYPNKGKITTNGKLTSLLDLCGT